MGTLLPSDLLPKVKIIEIHPKKIQKPIKKLHGEPNLTTLTNYHNVRLESYHLMIAYHHVSNLGNLLT